MISIEVPAYGMLSTGLFNFKTSQSKNSETQLMLTNLCDAFRGQPGSPNMVPFDVLV